MNTRILIAVAATLLLGACSGKNEPTATAPVTTATPVTPAPDQAAGPAAEAPTDTAATPVEQSTDIAAPALGEAPAAAEAEAPSTPPAPVIKASGKYADSIKVFQDAGASGTFFGRSYGFAVFPTIGKVGLGVGGAHGKGRVYVGGEHVGNTTVTQLSIGLQAGGQAYSQIIFFEDKRAFDEFSSGNFEFGATANAVAITAGASASAGTTGGSAGASGGQHDATTLGEYHKGMAVFTVAKGGLMYEASIGGQKFSYSPI